MHPFSEGSKKLKGIFYCLNHRRAVHLSWEIHKIEETISGRVEKSIKNCLLQKLSLFKYCMKRACRSKGLQSEKVSGLTQPKQQQLWGIIKGTASNDDLYRVLPSDSIPTFSAWCSWCASPSAKPSSRRGVFLTMPSVGALLPSKRAVFSLQILDMV